MLQYELGVPHFVTLVPYSRKLLVSATLSNDRLGIAVILDAANGAGFVDPEVCTIFFFVKGGNVDVGWVGTYCKNWFASKQVIFGYGSRWTWSWLTGKTFYPICCLQVGGFMH